VEGYTEEFEASFLELLRQSHPFSRVAAKVVYNDYIANKCGFGSALPVWIAGTAWGLMAHLSPRLNTDAETASNHRSRPHGLLIMLPWHILRAGLANLSNKAVLPFIAPAQPLGSPATTRAVPSYYTGTTCT